MIGQMFVNGLINAALIAPPAVAFSMFFGIFRFPNFAVGGYITVGVYTAYAVNVMWAMPLWLAAIAAMVAGALLAWLADKFIFAPMKDSAPVTLLVVSIALTFMLEHGIRLAFGAEVRGFDIPLARPIQISGVRIVPEQIYLIVMALAVVIATHLLLKFTPIGKAMRAMADNASLAEIRGIRSKLVRLATALYCGALLGLCGVAAGLDLVIEPLMGWSLTIPIIAAAILGGIGSVYGAMLGALLVGIIEELMFLVIPSAYKIGIGFVLITVLLLLRPHGLLGQPEIKK